METANHEAVCLKCKSTNISVERRGFSFKGMFKVIFVMIIGGILIYALGFLILLLFRLISFFPSIALYFLELFEQKYNDETLNETILVSFFLFASIPLAIMFLSIPIGLMRGMIGRKRIVNRCNNCSYVWKWKQLENAKTSTEVNHFEG